MTVLPEEEPGQKNANNPLDLTAANRFGRIAKTLGARGLGVGLSFAFAILTTRLFTPSILGGYYQTAITVANIAAAVLSIGLGQAALQLLNRDLGTGIRFGGFSPERPGEPCGSPFWPFPRLR